MNTKHNHSHDHCQHAHLKYCAHCDKPYCLDCGHEWNQNYSGNGYWWYYPYHNQMTTATPVWSISGVTVVADSNMVPETITTFGINGLGANGLGANAFGHDHSSHTLPTKP